MGVIVFLSYIRGRKTAIFWTAAVVGRDSSDLCIDWVNVGLGVTKDRAEVRGQRPEAGAQKKDHRDIY